MTGVTVSLIVMGSIMAIGYVYAQTTNSTQVTASESFAQSSTALIIAAVSIISAIATLLKSFVDRGLLDKRIGTAAVMAADTAHAVMDNRVQIQGLAQNGYETVKLTSPEAADKLTQAQKILDEATKRIDEYSEKVDKFAQIANSIGQQGEKTTDGIKQIKDKIPDEIVPS